MRPGRDAYRWPPCKLTAGAAARSMGLRLRSRGSRRQSPLTVLLLKDRGMLRGMAGKGALGRSHALPPDASETFLP